MTAKRFWTEATVSCDGSGYGILLDGRPVKTPAGAVFTLKHKPLADAICNEWQSQSDEINPDSMPFFKFSVTAIDRIAPQRQAVLDELHRFGCSDLLCYRGDAATSLGAYQDKIWQPYLDWAAEHRGISLEVFRGVLPHDQPPPAKSAMTENLTSCDDFILSGLHGLVTVSGSLILGLAVLWDYQPQAAVFEAAFLDNLWQQDKWGYDSEAAVYIDGRRRMFFDADNYIKMVQANGETGG